MAETASLRVQKFLADAGICSRRAAEELIAAGEVWVNGRSATLGQKVDPDSDKVVVRGKQERSAIRTPTSDHTRSKQTTRPCLFERRPEQPRHGVRHAAA